MKNIKILHVVPTLKKDGAEVQLALQMNHFKNVETELFTFDIYKKGNSVQSDLDNIKIHYNKFFKIYYLYKLIKKNNYKIIHSHLPMSDIVVGFLIYFDKSIKHVISIHAQYGTREGENRYKYKFFNFFWRCFLMRSDGIIAISKKIKLWLVNDFNINEENITTIHYGIKVKDRKQKQFNGNVIGMAARILPWKGWDKVLETCHYLNQAGVNFKLNLAGSDDVGYLDEIIKLINRYELQDKVTIYEHFQDIDKFFKDIDLFLFLTESEGFGLIVLEAIENNVAVICSDIYPLSEFVLNSNNALVNRDNTYEVATVIKSYFNDDGNLLNKVRSEQKNNVVENFTISKTVKKLEKFYINTINV